VKKRLSVFLCVILALASGLFAQDLPKPAGFVNDFAGVMRAEDIGSIENLAAAIQQKTGAELAVVTVKTYAPYAALDDFSLALAESWGIGRGGKDDGVLLILAADEREIKIEVGYGLEGAIPDSAAGRILDTAVIPAFRQGDFSGGLAAGARVIAAAIAKENGLDPADFNLTRTESPEDSGSPEFLYALVVLFIVLCRAGFPLFFASPFLGRRGFSSGGFGSSRSSFGGSGRSFGGFGGGGFGGGGASRRF
jgi:uncharacterized protein